MALSAVLALAAALHLAPVARGLTIMNANVVANAGNFAVDGVANANADVVLAAAPAMGIPEFVAPPLTPPQWIFISSPAQQKILYTRLTNFKSPTGRTFALIDSGLQEPMGISFDRTRGSLFVADKGAKAIYRYDVYAQSSGNDEYSLVTDGNRLTIMQGFPVEWVSVDESGDVLYSDPTGNTINKITVAVMTALLRGEMAAADLKVVSEKQQEAQDVEAKSMATATAGKPTTTEAPPLSPSILSLYEGSVNPQVSQPAGLIADGVTLYWANGASGTTAGSIVQGEVDPTLPPNLPEGSALPSYPATALSSNVDTSFGVAKSNTVIFFTSEDDVGNGNVWGRHVSSGLTYKFGSGLSKPRGLAWDGDGTIYVADQDTNSIWSFSCGRLIENVDLTLAAQVDGAYGLAMLASTDPAFHRSGARGALIGAIGVICGALATLRFV